ncbi:MAG TPA: chemotaxis protein CheW [Burkholderiaceae bacterium]
MSDDTSRLALVFRIAARLCALPLAQVVEIMRPLPVRQLDGTPGFVLGAAMVRGLPTPVVSGARLLGGEDAPAGGGRWIGVVAGSRRVMLEVDEVGGIRRIPAGDGAAAQPLLEGVAADRIATLGRLDGELLSTLQAARVVPELAWSAIDAALGAAA